MYFVPLIFVTSCGDVPHEAEIFFLSWIWMNAMCESPVEGKWASLKVSKFYCHYNLEKDKAYYKFLCWGTEVPSDSASFLFQYVCRSNSTVFLQFWTKTKPSNFKLNDKMEEIIVCGVGFLFYKLKSQNSITKHLRNLAELTIRVFIFLFHSSLS